MNEIRRLLGQIIEKIKYNKPTQVAIMSYEFVNQTTEICRKFSRQSWAKALELAQLYGWHPLGTIQPPHLDFHKLNAEWDGRYLTNDGQIVKAEDALFLAIALEKSLDNIPDKNVETNWNLKLWFEDDLPEWLSPEEKEFIEEELQDGLLDIMGVHPFKYFAGYEKQYLKGFIKFCRAGSLRYYENPPYFAWHTGNYSLSPIGR